MMHWFGGGGFNLWMLLYSLCWLLIIAGGFLLLRSYLVNPPLRVGSERSALEILRERYAKGELSKDEYLQIKQDLNDEEDNQ